MLPHAIYFRESRRAAAVCSTKNTRRMGIADDKDGGFARSNMRHGARCIIDAKIPPTSSFIDTGVSGITVCASWEKFETFLADMEPKPSPDLSIERINNDAGYSPENCKWATITEQNANMHRAKSYQRSHRFGKPKRKGLTSKYKGVGLNKRDNVWFAFIYYPRSTFVWLVDFGMRMTRRGLTIRQH